jgi:peptidyl-prolyl cis-trans isomerase B (cyclophilin B)
VASSKREKELARQRAERQAARRAAATQRKKQRQAIIASVVAVLLVGTAITAAAVTLGGGDDPTDIAAPGVTPAASVQASTAASDEPSVAASPAASAPEPSRAAGDPGCEYVPTEGPATREVTFPPTENVETKQVYDVTLTTNRGDIVFEMDSAQAPCTANNFRSLAHFKYFADTPCHRLTTEGISVLQCGSPDGSGNGGPGYSFADENLEGATYERGTVAMANSGPGTNGSQFFLVYEDSSLPPNFTPFGTITAGLDVLEEVADAGSDEANGAGDGMPNLPIQIQEVRARPQGA